MKRVFYLLSLCLLLNMTWLSAQTVSTWDGSAAIWTQGSGTQADPYLIESAQNLAWIAEMVNGGVATYAGVWFKLTTDLNMNNVAWVPIGNSTTNLFRGKFDGDNHFIDNISITGSYTYKGLFGITGADFRCENLGVNTSISSAGDYGGGVVAYINGNNTVIQNCNNMGTVRGKYGAGGIVGYANNCSNVIINICNNGGSISSTSANSNAGGIVGCTNGCDSVIIVSCYNKGDVACSASPVSGGIATSYSGGIIGASKGNMSYCLVSHCYNRGSISSSATAAPTALPPRSEAYAGGIAAVANKITYCYNTGSISSSAYFSQGTSNYSHSWAYSGGIAADASSLTFNFNTGPISSIARSDDNSTGTGAREAYSGGICGSGSTILNSYNRGDVGALAYYGSHLTNGSRKSGGIAGKSTGTINNCYNTGTLTSGSQGGICGTTNCVVTNCYYTSTCGGSGSGTSQTETVMKSSSFPVLLNAGATIYVMDGTPNVNNGYPIFGDGTYVLSQNASQISFHSAILNGIYYGPADVVGFEYKKASDSKYTTVYTNVGSPASYQLTGLSSGTEYTYRFFVQKNGLMLYGGDKTFTTLACDLQASISKSATAICQDDTATFTATCSSTHSNTFTYSWSDNSSTNQIQVLNGNTYTVTVSDTNGCSTTASASVTVNPVPQGVISGSTSLCTGESTTLTASGANSYHWSTGATTPVITVNNSGTYTCTFTNSYGCTATQSVTVSVFATPVITGNTAICDGGSTTLTATGGSSYVWSNGATTPSITVNAAGTYTVTATQGNCSASSNVTTTVVGSPTPTITGNTSLCAGESTTLVANGGYSYQWSNGESGASITVTQSGTYSVLATNAAGCTSQTSIAVVVNPLPNVTISGNQSICAGTTATLTASGANSYVWDDGSTNAQLPVVSAGEYSVTGTNSQGCTNTASISVVVNPVPQGVISGNTNLCLGETTTLTASGANSYQWNTGASTSAIIVNNGGVYTCVFTNGYGCSSSESVTVTEQATPSISGISTLCEGQSTTLTAIGGTSYLWSNGLSTPSITAQTSGQYSVTAFMGNCSASASINVTVYPIPTPSILGNTTVCQGQSTPLTANGGEEYVWSNGSTQPTIVVNTGGSYFVTVSNSAGCSATANITVTVNPLPSVNISGNSSFCQGDNVTLTATGANTYAWNNTSTNTAITVSSAGSYTVTGTDANGCSNIATKTVAVNPTYNIPLTHSMCEGESYNFYGQNITAAGTYTHTLQTVNGCDSVLTLVVTLKALPPTVITGNTSLCEGETTTLTATGGVSYAWSNGGASNSTSVNQSGVYTVTATNAEGCSATANVTVTVNPLPSVNISGNSSFCQGDNVILTATGANTYVWNNASSNAAITVSSAGTYAVTGTDANGCSNIATKTVAVNPTYNIPLTHSICEGESYNFYGQNITAAGTYTHTLQTVNGCDSVLTLVVTLKALPPTAITGNSTICEGETTTLTANGGNSYAWSNGSTNNNINVSQSGVYTVTATNAEGCSNTANVTVTVNPLPTITIGGNTTLCAGNSTTLTASGADSYSWSTGDNTASVNISAFGIYTVTGTTTAGCSGTAEVTVLVSQLPVITISGETDICAGESTTLTATGGESYLWSDGTTGNTLTVNMAGTYQVIGYNAAGCYSIADATVSVWQPATSEFTVSCPDSCYLWNGESYCQSGDYTQTLQTVHGCDSVVTLHLTITVGIDDHNLAVSMTVYPNPTNGVVNVQCTMNNVQMGTMEILVYDAFGRLLRMTDGVGANNYSPLQMDTQGSSTQTQIDLSRFAPGVYFVKAVADGNVVAVRKVIRN